MGELHGVKALSSAHWKVAPASLVKEKDGLESLLGLLGDAVMVALGAAVSIVQVKLTAGPVLPAVSVALTWSVCEPSATAA